MSRKILYVASVFQHIHDFHLPYLRELHRQGYAVDLACRFPAADRKTADLSREMLRERSRYGGDLSCIHDLVDVPFEKSMTSVSNFRASAMLRRRIRRERYDLIIVHTSLAAFFTRLALKGLRSGPKVINMVHGYLFDDRTPAGRRRILEQAECMVRGETDLVMTMNRWDYTLAVRRHLGKQVVQIPGIGLDTERLEPAERLYSGGNPALRKQLGIPESAFVMIFAAEFSGRKNQETLIRGMAHLPDHAVLLLPGDGDRLTACRELAERTAPGRVILPGYIPEIREWYAMADMAVSSSRYEGLPVNILEAMYFGLPVAATRIKGHVDLLGGDSAAGTRRDAGRTGYEPSDREQPAGLFWECGDDGAFADCVRKLMDAPALRQALGTEARKRIPDYLLETAGPQVMKYYLSML